MKWKPAADKVLHKPAAVSMDRRHAGLVLRLLISLGVLGWLIGHVHWQPIWEALAGVHLGCWSAALGIYCAAQVVSSYRWMLLARPLGFSEPLPRFAGLYFMGMFFNLFLPTSMGGDVVRAWRLAGRPGRRGAAFLSVIGERLSGLVALMLLACAASLLAGESASAGATVTIWGVTLAGVLGWLLLPRLGGIHPKLRALAESMSLCGRDRRRWWTALVLSFLVQAASAVQIWLLGVGLGLPAPFLAYAVAVPLVTLATLLPISLNGIGIREASLALFLGGSGVDSSGALALGLLWLTMLLAAGALGGVAFALGGRDAEAQGELDHGRVGGGADQGRTRQSAAAA